MIGICSSHITCETQKVTGFKMFTFFGRFYVDPSRSQQSSRVYRNQIKIKHNNHFFENKLSEVGMYLLFVISILSSLMAFYKYISQPVSWFKVEKTSDKTIQKIKRLFFLIYETAINNCNNFIIRHKTCRKLHNIAHKPNYSRLQPYFK